MSELRVDAHPFDAYQVPSQNRRESVTLQRGELILEPVERGVSRKAMDRKRWPFPQVGVAAAVVGAESVARALVERALAALR